MNISSKFHVSVFIYSRVMHERRKHHNIFAYRSIDGSISYSFDIAGFIYFTFHNPIF